MKKSRINRIVKKRKEKNIPFKRGPNLTKFYEF